MSAGAGNLLARSSGLQPELALCTPEPPARIGDIWLVDCDASARPTVLRALSEGGQVLVDAFTAASSAGPEDILLVRSGDGEYSICAAGTHPAPRAASVRGRLEDAVDMDGSVGPGASGYPVDELLMLTLGTRARACPTPGAASSGLQRALARLARTRGCAPGPLARFCSDLGRSLPRAPHPAVRAIVHRCTADALVDVDLDAGPGGRGSPMVAAASYAQAAAAFREAGFQGLGLHARGCFRLAAGLGGAQLRLDLGDGWGERVPSRTGFRHRVDRLLALRLTSRDQGPPASARQALSWRRVGTMAIPDAMISRLTWGATGRTTRAACSIEWGDAPAGWRLKAGMDAELSVLLGQAGRSGPKPGGYAARVTSATCLVSPRSARGRIGELTEFLVQPDGEGWHTVEVELSLDAECHTSLSLSVPGRTPDDDIRPGDAPPERPDHGPRRPRRRAPPSHHRG